MAPSFTTRALLLFLAVASSAGEFVESDSIAAWIEREAVNRYGDAPGTVYTGGTPLFDESAGVPRPLAEYVVSQHPNRPWLCPTAATVMPGAPVTHPVTPGATLPAGAVGAAQWAATHIVDADVSAEQAAGTQVYCVRTQVVAGTNFMLTIGAGGVAYEVNVFRALPAGNGGDGKLTLSSSKRLGALIVPSARSTNKFLGSTGGSQSADNSAEAAAAGAIATPVEDDGAPLDVESKLFVGGTAVVFVALIGIAGGALYAMQRRPMVVDTSI